MAFAMAFTMMATAGAAYTDQADIEATEAVEMLNTLGIMTGDPDGSFRPNDTITRAEACRMIYSIRTNSDDASAYANMQTTFTDVPADAWYAGYVKHCQSVGIVSGRSETVFDPNSDVTGVELALMCLRVMGYDPAIANIGGSTWSTTTIGLATENGLLEDVTTGITSSCPRQYAAQIMYNMILASTVRWSDDAGKYNNTNYLGEKYETVGEKYLKLYIAVGTLVSVDTKNLTISQSDSDVQDTDKAVRGMTGFTNLPNDYSDLLGQKVKVLIRDQKSNDVIGVYPNGDSIVYSVNAVDVSKDDNKVKFEGSSYSVEYFGNDSNKTINDKATGDAIATYIDGQVANGTTLTELDNNKLNPNQYTFVDTDGNGKIDTLVVKTFDVAKVTYAASDKIIANGKTYKFADENIAEDIVKNDWIVITKNLYNDNLDIVKAELSTGTLDALRDGKTDNVYFDGASALVSANYSEYEIGDTWYAGGDKLQSTVSENDLNAVKAGEDVEFVAVNGIMFYVKKASGDNTGKVDNVALVVKKDGTGVDDRVKLAFFDGTTKTVDVDDDNANTVKFSDGNSMTNDPTKELIEGVVYEYAVSGDQYSFYTLKPGVGTGNEKYEEYYGDLTFLGTTTVNALTGVSADKYSVETIQNADSFGDMKIDDKAEILLFNNSTKTSAQITGKQFNSIADLDNIDNKGNGLKAAVAYAFSGDMSGLDRIGALALEVDAGTELGEISSQTWGNYAFILSDAKWVVRNKTMEYTIWNGVEALTVQEDYNNLNARKARTAIGYDKLTTGDVNVIDDVQLLDSGITNFHIDAITDVSNDGKTIKLSNGPELDVSDATILYVDSDAKTGMTSEQGTIKEAIKDLDDNYLANVLYINVGSDAELLIVDQLTYLKSDYYETNLASDFSGKVIYGGNAVTGNEKTVTFGALPTLTVNAAVDQSITINTTNIDNGKTVTAQLTSDSTGTIPASNGTLTVANGTVSGNSATIKMTGTPATEGDVYLKVSVDGVTNTSGKMTIAAADKTVMEQIKEAIATAFDDNADATGSKANPYELTAVLDQAAQVGQQGSFEIALAKYFEGYTVTAAEADDMNGLTNDYGKANYTLSQDGTKITIADDASGSTFANDDQFGIELTVTEDATGTATKLYALVTLDASEAEAAAAQKAVDDTVDSIESALTTASATGTGTAADPYVVTLTGLSTSWSDTTDRDIDVLTSITVGSGVTVTAAKVVAADEGVTTSITESAAIDSAKFDTNKISVHKTTTAGTDGQGAVIEVTVSGASGTTPATMYIVVTLSAA